MQRIRKRQGERWRRLAALLQDSREIGRSSLARRAVRAARAAFHSHARSLHAMWCHPRSRARFNRACVRRALAPLSTTAMMFFQRGGANLARLPLSSMAWSRALRGVGSASRISPLSFDGDKRGRMRQFHEALAFDQKFFSRSAVSLRLLADPRAIPYLGPNLTSSACPMRQHASKSSGSSSRRLGPSLFVPCLEPSRLRGFG